MDVYFILKFLNSKHDGINIVYTGFYHIEIYIKFFNRWFETEPNNFIYNDFSKYYNTKLRIITY